MNPLMRLYWTAKGVGWDNLPRRVLQAVRVRSGRLRKRCDAERFNDRAFRAATGIVEAGQHGRWQQRARQFFPLHSRESLQSACDDATWQACVNDVCDAALTGRYPMFSRWSGDLGWPPDFNRDPVNDIDWPTGVHWLDSARSGPPRDDIKLVWEASRLTLAFHLGRAYRRDGDARRAEAFWTLLDAWIEQNPPMLTVNWGCGQEATFRLMAALFGAFATLDSEAANEERIHRLTRLAWQTGRRIEANINYALSQKNNHGISEAAGLWTIGLLFREFPEADHWRSMGRRFLVREARRQIYRDGSYVQHSLNYHRVMLDDLLWAMRLGEINNQPIDELREPFTRATEWLGQMIDPESGRVPNYGANDGANVLPLSASDYLDYRPTLQAAWHLAHGKRFFASGEWDEKALWLIGESAMAAEVAPPPQEPAWSADAGGYHVLRGPGSWAMMRCHTYRDRPGQADMLHLDLWMDGVNVLRDGGTYRYYDQAGMGKWFKSTAAHNTIEIDGMDQMIHGPRFLWFNWTKSRLRMTGENHLLGQHEGYRRLFKPPLTYCPMSLDHNRLVMRQGDVWFIWDPMLIPSARSHRVILRWRLCPGQWESPSEGLWRQVGPGPDLAVFVRSPAPVELIEGQQVPTEGWESLYYGEMSEAPTLVSTIEGGVLADFLTILTPGSGENIRDGLLSQFHKKLDRLHGKPQTIRAIR